MAHWSEEKEKVSGFWPLQLAMTAYRICGPRFLRFTLRPVVAGFWLFSPGARRASRQYLERVAHQAALGTSLPNVETAQTGGPVEVKSSGSDAPVAGSRQADASADGRDEADEALAILARRQSADPKSGADSFRGIGGRTGPYRYRRGDSWRHLYCFACSLIEKLAAWTDDLDLQDLDIETDGVAELVNSLNAGKGGLILVSHLGNMEMLRALASLKVVKVLRNFGINSIVDFSGTANFNRLLAEANPESMVRLVPANDMGPETIIMLQERIAAGELVCIAGDRTPANNRGRTNRVEFLGDPAWFPQGGFVLASLVDAPVWMLFGVRRDDLDPESRYGFHVYRSLVDLSGSRRERMVKIQKLMEEYVAHLERLCIQHPFQWYNFFDFWTDPQSGKPSMGDA